MVIMKINVTTRKILWHNVKWKGQDSKSLCAFWFQSYEDKEMNKIKEQFYSSAGILHTYKNQQ